MVLCRTGIAICVGGRQGLGATSGSLQVPCFVGACGWHWLGSIAWPLLLSVLMLTSLGLTALGFFIAWFVNGQCLPRVASNAFTSALDLTAPCFPLIWRVIAGQSMRLNPAVRMTGLRHAL